MYHTLQAVPDIIFEVYWQILKKKNPLAKHIFSSQNVCMLGMTYVFRNTAVKLLPNYYRGTWGPVEQEYC